PGLCVGFNVDVRDPRLFLGPPEAQFGYKVLQRVDDGEKWLLVAAPWDGDGQGDVYKCRVGPQNATCDKANLEGKLRHGGVRRGRVSGCVSPHVPTCPHVSPCPPGQACAPLWSQTCGTSVFSTGACARLDGELRAVGTMAPTAQRCSTYMDIVIVLDGSNSIYPWVEVQNFLSNVLSRFFIGPGQIQVGVLQYGEHAVHEWALGRYRSAQEVVEAARNISRQEGRETRTAMAVRTACTEAFSPERGGRADATRLMIVVTDGESHDGEELPEALAECDKRNVTRYAIAVSTHSPCVPCLSFPIPPACRASVSPFPLRAVPGINSWNSIWRNNVPSAPSPGTHGYNASSFELEMSQIGFSVHVLEDGLLFGTVGAYDWEGAVLEESGRGRIVPPRSQLRPHFPPQLKNHAAYLGTGVAPGPGGVWGAIGVLGGVQWVSGGGHSRAGGVAVGLKGMQQPWDDTAGPGGDAQPRVPPLSPVPVLEPTAALGVPVSPQRLLSPAGTLRPEPRPQDSRFGFAMAALPDLNHDGLGDAAVGAPLEGGHRGALYIFHGAPGTLLPQYKQ
ncbi:ITA10 protein, partial [Caloenas nicobarica]|nr:ITA10 protein [Caloenas nicobarica]